MKKYMGNLPPLKIYNKNGDVSLVHKNILILGKRYFNNITAKKIKNSRGFIVMEYEVENETYSRAEMARIVKNLIIQELFYSFDKRYIDNFRKSEKSSSIYFKYKNYTIRISDHEVVTGFNLNIVIDLNRNFNIDMIINKIQSI